MIDRLWTPILFDRWTQISTSQTVSPKNKNRDRVPSIVMSTAAAPVNESLPLEFYFNAADTSTKFYYYLHFSELQKLKAEQYRAFNVTANEELWIAVVPVYLKTTTIFNIGPISGSLSYNFSISKLANSTLPPILNAAEVYSLVDFQQLETDENDGTSFFPHTCFFFFFFLA